MPAQPTSLKGKLLIASPRLGDPNFHQTIVLMLRDEEGEGAMGLVLNRPLRLTVKEACEQALETECNVDGPLYQGGPCEGPLMVLHGDDAEGGELEIAAGVHVTTDRDQVERLLAAGGEHVKCFLGYSGWGQGQLAGEMAEGAWLTYPATAALVFDADDRDWAKLMTHLTYGPNLPLDRIPDDPSVN